MFNKTLLATSLAAGILLMAAPVAFAEKEASTTPAMSAAEVATKITCVGAAVAARETAIDTAMTAYTQAVNAAYAARLLFLGGMVGFCFFTTQFLQEVMLYKPLHAGLAFLPTTIPNFLSAIWVPRLSRKFGNARLLAFGLILCIAGMTWLAGLTHLSVYFPDIALPMLLLGIGQGFVLAPLTVSSVKGVASEDAGAASGVVNVAHQLGNSLGLSILVVVFAFGGSVEPSATAALAQHIARALTGSAIMLGGALALVILFIVRPHRQDYPAQRASS